MIREKTMNECAENDVLLSSPSASKWKTIGTARRSGMVVPLFSVYSRLTVGSGEIGDIPLLVDLCVSTGNAILQLLPMNELGPAFCPYDSVSSFALEPMYLSLRNIRGVTLSEGELKRLQGLAVRFKPSGKRYADYGVKGAKLELLWDIFHRAHADTSDFAGFRDGQAYWLDDFALFKVIKQYNAGKAWYDWEPELRDRDEAALERFAREHDEELLFQKWLQWQLYIQFRAAKEYAAQKSVFVKGDLPILVSRDSADVWAHKELFKLEYDSGAPPDMYCAKGQRWGTSTYDWEEIFADNGDYLKAKLAYAENFYDMLRLDHVVGLFRIWSIPVNEPKENYGLNGVFDPKDKSTWEAHGKKILDFIIANTRMLLCAEDLGTIPPECPKVLKAQGIAGNDVQRWTKDWDKRHDFLPPAEYRFLSVTMLSTHDTTNWPAWWENEAGTVDEALFARLCAEKGIDFAQVRPRLFEDALSRHGRLRWKDSVRSVEEFLAVMGRTKNDLWTVAEMYENTYHEKEKLWKLLGLPGQMREKSGPDLVAAVTRAALASRSIFFFNLILDWLYLDRILESDPYGYRINVPGTVAPTNWSLLMPLPLEELIAHPVVSTIRRLITESGRSG